jgi:cell division protein FtsW (lipid II flippase)
MYKYLKAHESLIKEALLNDKQDFNELLNFHKTQIDFLQHERLIHLLVTFFVFAMVIICVALTMIYQIILLYVLCLILMILSIFYIVHYYQLENGVQRWYLLYNEIRNKINSN